MGSKGSVSEKVCVVSARDEESDVRVQRRTDLPSISRRRAREGSWSLS
jgi:hypothetical protein